MQSISISTNWLSSKPIDSCIFLKHITGDNKNDQNRSDSEPNEDIETLLESYENCVKLIEQISDSDEESKECKLFIQTVNESDEEFITRIDSFSMLCSAKVVEIHGNDSNEYLTTVFNELVDELDGLSMFRSDYNCNESQKQITITFKSFKELWIYGLVIKLIRVKREPVIPSKDVTSFASVFNMISMFSNASKNSSSVDLIQKLSQIKTSEECEAISGNSVPILSANTDNRQNSVEHKTNSSEEQFCECLCHKNRVSDQNREYLCQYIDQKVSDLETSIENKFNSLENKMFSVLNLFINKQ